MVDADPTAQPSQRGDPDSARHALEPVAKQRFKLLPITKVGLEWLVFYCPGCSEIHFYPTKGKGAQWWNGNLEAPTTEGNLREWADTKGRTKRCHYRVLDGALEFGDDSTHDLAGKGSVAVIARL